jgi:hypothetical protein
MLVVKALNAGRAMQAALEEQRRQDLFFLVCQSCGGLGVVVDLANRWYGCPHPFHTEPESQCSEAEMLYGGKVCPECG